MLIEFIQYQFMKGGGQIEFEDSNTETAILSLFDYNSDGYITYAEAASTTGESLFTNKTGIYAFEEFQYFENVSLENTRTNNMYSGAFNGCTNLTKIKLNDKHTVIGNYAFRNCSSLTKIELPATVTTIRDAVFWNTTNLTTIICRATTPPTLTSSDTGIGTGKSVYVPDESLELYSTAENWNTLYEQGIIKPLSEYTE